MFHFMQKEHTDKCIIEPWVVEPNGTHATKTPVEIWQILSHRYYENEEDFNNKKRYYIFKVKQTRKFEGFDGHAYATDFAYTEAAMRLLMEYLMEQDLE